MTDGYPSHQCGRVAGVCWDLVRFATADKRGLLVTGNWSDPTMPLCLTLLAMRRRPFVIWTDTPYLAKRRNPLKAGLRLAWLRYIFARATRVMGTGTPALAALGQMGCPAHKLVNFPYFVDLDAYFPSFAIKQRFDPTRPVRFLSVGTVIRAIKGHDIALTALADARKLAGRDNFEYRIVGSGMDLDTLRRQVHQLGLDDRVAFLGWLEPDGVQALYRESDILIHPSRRDAFGAAVLEAMAAGLAVLGSDATAAVCDRIRHGENGFIHRTGDGDELARQIADLLLHPEKIHTLCCRARRTAEEWPAERGVQIVKDILIEIHGAK